HVVPNGTYVTTPQVTADSARVDVTTTIRNDADDVGISLVTTISDDRGAEVARVSTNAGFHATSTLNVEQSLSLSHPQRWSVDHPHLYDVRTQIISGGNVLDE